MFMLLYKEYNFKSWLVGGLKYSHGFTLVQTLVFDRPLGISWNLLTYPVTNLRLQPAASDRQFCKYSKGN